MLTINERVTIKERLRRLVFSHSARSYSSLTFRILRRSLSTDSKQIDKRLLRLILYFLFPTNTLFTRKTTRHCVRYEPRPRELAYVV
jgi:hypothetical protein